MAKQELVAGIEGCQVETVNANHSAANVGSGLLNVYSTPSLLALIEKTAWNSVCDCLEEGQGTVGTSVKLDHVASSPMGMQVCCETELVAVEGRKLVFKANVYNELENDQRELIATADHERFIVNNEKFQAKTDAKA